MKRIVYVLLAGLVVFCVYQARSLRLMKSELERLKADLAGETKSLALQQFTNERLDEVRRSVTWLDEYYQSPEGLQRKRGLCDGDRIDAEGLTAWLFGTYLRLRIDGAPEGVARQTVIDAIRRNPDWQRLHPS